LLGEELISEQMVEKIAGWRHSGFNVHSRFRAARKLDAGAFIFEIARSEISYTDQRPSEYVSAVLTAAIKEDYRGPVFIQGDHFQASAKKFKQDPESEIKAIKELIEEAIAAGFFNIDIDTSTLVDISKPDLDEQQKLNYELCAEFTRFIREKQPAGVTISVGGEIGEVGERNSTEEDLEKQCAFLFEQLNIKGTKTVVGKFIKAPEIHHAEPLAVKAGKKESTEGLAD